MLFKKYNFLTKLSPKHLKYLIYLCLIINFSTQALELEINVQGVSAELEQQILEELKSYTRDENDDLTERSVKHLYDISSNEIKSLLESYGFYNSQVSKHIRKTRNKWLIEFQVDSGPAVILEEVVWEIVGPAKDDYNLNKEIRNILKNFQINTNLSHKKYEEVKYKILNKFKYFGYFDCSFIINEIQIDRNTHKAKIIFKVDSQKRYKFGTVQFSGTQYKESLLNRYLPFAYGDGYSLDKIFKLQENLENADLFRKIRISPQPEFNKKQLYVPISVVLEAKPQNKYTFSLGYGTDTGARGSVNWLRTRLGYPGHKLDTYLSLSEIKTNATVNYIIPGKRAPNDRYIIGANICETQVDIDRYSLKSEVALAKYQTRGNTQVSYSLNYFSEKFRLLLGESSRTKSFLLPTFNLSFTRPDRHQRIDSYVRFAVQDFGSDVSVGQFEINTKKIIYNANKLNKLIFKLGFGMILVDSQNFTELPPSLRFYAGGDSSVRGYGYQDLGPKGIDRKGDEVVVGGKYLATTSIEFERYVYKNFGLATFMDSGNALDQLKPEFGVGIGVGLRYQTPIGSLKFDIAKPLNFAKKDEFRFHITFGTEL